MSADIDGFYGEPAPYDAALEVDMMVVEQAAAVIAITNDLEDEWFAFDETKEVTEEWDVPTSSWQRFGGWLRSIGRAA